MSAYDVWQESVWRNDPDKTLTAREIFNAGMTEAARICRERADRSASPLTSQYLCDAAEAIEKARGE